MVSTAYLFPKYHTVINSSIVQDTFSAALKTHIKQKRKRIVQSLVVVLQQTTHMFKKSVQIVNEETARLRLRELKLKSNSVAQDFNEFNQFCALHRKEMELEQQKNVLSHYLHKHLEATIVMSHSLVKLMPLMFVDSSDHSMAHMVQSQINFEKKISNEPVEVPREDARVPSLEALKNLYFLLNSGMIRRLGLCFCPVVWKKELNSSQALFEVMRETEVYLNKCCIILNDLKFYYKRNVLSEWSKKKNIDSSLVEGYSLVHKICVASRNLVSDASSLELFVEEESEGKAKWVLRTLDVLKEELRACLECIEKAEKFYKRSVGGEKLRVGVEGEQGEGGGEEKSLQLGERNTLMGDEDEVYFGLTEGKPEGGDGGGDSWDEPGPQFPDYLITELKQSLVGKKTEFDERELKAVKNDAEYLRFLEEPAPGPPHEEVLPEPVSIPPCQLELHKLLALNAASKSSQFLKINEECFGSDDDLSDEY